MCPFITPNIVCFLSSCLVWAKHSFILNDKQKCLLLREFIKNCEIWVWHKPCQYFLACLLSFTSSFLSGIQCYSPHRRASIFKHQCWTLNSFFPILFRFQSHFNARQFLSILKKLTFCALVIGLWSGKASLLWLYSNLFHSNQPTRLSEIAMDKAQHNNSPHKRASIGLRVSVLKLRWSELLREYVRNAWRLRKIDAVASTKHANCQCCSRP